MAVDYNVNLRCNPAVTARVLFYINNVFSTRYNLKYVVRFRSNTVMDITLAPLRGWFCGINPGLGEYRLSVCASREPF